MKASLNGSHYFLYLDWLEFHNLPVEEVSAEVKREGSIKNISELVKVNYPYKHREETKSRVEHEPQNIQRRNTQLISISLCVSDYLRLKKEKSTIIRSGLFSYNIEVVDKLDDISL